MTVERTIRIARPVGPDRSRRCGSRVVRSATMLAPTSREPARCTVTTASTAVKPTIGSRASGCGAVSGWSSSTQPSGDAQISCVETDSRVGDHSHGVRDAEERGGIRRGLTSSRAELARERAHRQEHQRRCHHCQREVQGRTGGDIHARVHTGEHGDDCGNRPEREDAATETGQMPEAPRCRLRGLPGEQQFPASAVLLAAQQPGARQQPPHGAECHQGHGDLEDGEAGDGLEVRGRSEERARRLVRSVRSREGVPLRPGSCRSLV